MPQTLTDIKNLLAAYGLHPKHRYGQNFLHDYNQLRRILKAADIQPGDHVLEVGPGTGTLTEQLLEAGANVLAVEVDTDLKPLLEDHFAKYLSAQGDRLAQPLENPWEKGSDTFFAPKLTKNEPDPGVSGVFQRPLVFIFEDVLAGKHELNPRVLEAVGSQPFKLIANLPYNVASPLLANLAADCPAMTLAIVMVQKEVADRLTASPGTKAYGPLGILLQTLCHITALASLSPGCFWPQPKVASAVVKLVRREQPLISDPARFSATLQRLFTKRRKQLKSILGESIVKEAGLPPTARPETLSLDELVSLDQTLAAYPPA